MLRTPGESPIVLTTKQKMNHQKTKSTSSNDGDQQQQQQQQLQFQQKIQDEISQIYQQQQPHRHHPPHSMSVSSTTSSSKKKINGELPSSLHVDDVGISIRLMQCLEASQRRQQQKSHHQHHHDQQPPVQMHVNSRFTESLRTTTLATKEEDWKRRMESIKKMRDEKRSELHRRIQTHRLFKHYAFEQRKAASMNPSSSCSYPSDRETIELTNNNNNNLINRSAATIGTASAVSRDNNNNNNNSFEDSRNPQQLFPTTVNSLTKEQVEDYFSIPSFVRPMLTSTK